MQRFGAREGLVVLRKGEFAAYLNIWAAEAGQRHVGIGSTNYVGRYGSFAFSVAQIASKMWGMAVATNVARQGFAKDSANPRVAKDAVSLFPSLFAVLMFCNP